MIDYKKELNEEQYKAVMHDKGPALLLAGAGTGKTRTALELIERRISEKKVSKALWQIMVFLLKVVSVQKVSCSLPLPTKPLPK